MERLLLILGFCACVGSWDPDAGIIQSYTKNSHVTVSTTSGSQTEHIIDSNDNTNWISSYCLPGGYVNRQDVNVLHGACAQGLCSSANSQNSDLAKATDGSFYTTSHVQNSNQGASLTIQLKRPDILSVISVSGVFPAVTELNAYEQTSAGLQKHLLRTYTSQDNYNTINFMDVNFTISKLELTSQSDFTLKEIAAIGSDGCTETVTVDLGAIQDVGTIRTRHWAGTHSASKLALKVSADGQNWTAVADLNPDALHAITTTIDPQISARYIALVYTVKLVNYMKVYCYEIDAWDENGVWGPKINAKPQKNTFRDLLGVNGIWGWGTGKYSDSLTTNEGPQLYNQVASHGRNYHNLNWDVTDPDNDPGFANMSAGHGTQAMWWLNWDKEYRAWTAANMSVDISIQFTNKTAPQYTWNHPEQSAYHYGQEIAKHFGPTNGNGLVTAVEVGNEPWDYDASFYATVLKGMTAGLKSGDNNMIVIPGTFQAEDKHHTNTYIGTRVLPEVADSIDIINCHTYSFVNDDNGVRRGTYPENKRSSFNNIRSITRWRDANVPYKPIWVTEWGWDSYGVGENCKGTECVGETAQAIYALRGLLLMARSNIERAYWYFYANTDCETLFCRSGLTASSKHHFQKKAAFYALQDFLDYVGDEYFLGIIQEDGNGFIYALSKHSKADSANMDIQTLLQQTSYIVGWLPVDANDTTSIQAAVNLPDGTHAPQARRFTGDNNSPSTVATASDYTMNGRTLTLHLSTEPLVLKIEHKSQVIVGRL